MRNPSLPSHPLPEPRLVGDLSASLAAKLDIRLPGPILDWILGSGEIAQIWSAAQSGPGDLFSELLKALEVSVDFRDDDLAQIPRTGPVLIAANHPHGLLDGLVLGSLLVRVRPDFRFLANSLLASLPGLADRIIPVDPFSSEHAEYGNAGALLRAFRYLKRGGALVVFPAGEVSSLQPGLRGVSDSRWSTEAFELALRAKAPIVPFYLHGRNGVGFQVAGLVHPILRTALLGRELINKRTSSVRVAVGRRAHPDSMRARGAAATASFIRQRTYALARRFEDGSVRNKMSHRKPIEAPIHQAALETEVDALPDSCRLFERGDSAVYLADAPLIPSCLDEIGRLRETTFRAAGEGTGKASDQDRFDRYYRHLFLWNRRAKEIVGAYRVGDIQQIYSTLGVHGLYTRTLFHYDHKFIEPLAPGFELGRSFVRVEYQRQVHPLSYLWKGIGALLAQRPEVRYLIGPVSISSDYSAVARELIEAYFAVRRDAESEVWIRPSKLRLRPIRPALYELAREIRSFGELSDLAGDLQGQGRDVPVLLRHYTNLGGRVVGFNKDARFSNAMDALMVLDLDAADPATLERYIGVRRPR